MGLSSRVVSIALTALPAMLPLGGGPGGSTMAFMVKDGGAPGSRFERVDAAGHSTYFERPDVFNREVGAFLKEHRP